MQDLIQLIKGDKIVARCGPNCYNPPAGHLPCICRGVNRGVGRKQAAANTLEHWPTWIAPHPFDPPDWADAIVKLNPELELIAFQKILPFPEPVPAR